MTARWKERWQKRESIGNFWSSSARLEQVVHRGPPWPGSAMGEPSDRGAAGEQLDSQVRGGILRGVMQRVGQAAQTGIPRVGD